MKHVGYVELPEHTGVAGALVCKHADLVTSANRALPMFWKRPIVLVGRHGLEPWTR